MDRKTNLVEKMKNKQAKEKQIKGEIIIAAKNLFQKYGLNKTTMEDIAKAAGKGKSTLYYYYTSKDDVFVAAIVEEMNQVISEVKQIVDRYRSAEEKLKIYIDSTFKVLHNKVILYDIVCGELKSNLDQLLRKQRDAFDLQEVSLLKEIMLLGLQTKEFDGFSEDNVEMLARTFISGLRGIEIDLFLENKLSEWVKGMDLVTNILLRGLKRV